jgi:hypothetical protein
MIWVLVVWAVAVLLVWAFFAGAGANKRKD